MVYTWYIIPLLVPTVVLADYYINNANTSVVYAMPPGTQSEQSWGTFSVSTRQLELQLSNSTGNYTITLDASNCYDQDYALGVCGTNDGCFIEIPFTGSGITMYVFNAGASGMAASFSVDGGTPVSRSIQGPTAAENYQVSNVSIYDIQNLPSRNHTIQMTLLDWNGGGTSMKFDYAYVNESFVAEQTSTTSLATTASKPTLQASTQTASQTSTGSSSSSNKNANVGAIVGATLGGAIALAGLVIGFFYFRKRRASPQDTSVPQASFHLDPFTGHPTIPTIHSNSYLTQLPDESANVPPLTRSAILRDAHAIGRSSTEPIQNSQSNISGMNLSILQPLRRHPSYSADSDPHVSPNISYAAEIRPLSPFSDVANPAQYNLTSDQLDVIYRLRADNVPSETISRVIEEFVSSQLTGGETSGGRGTRAESIFSSVPPPSYQTRDR